MKNNKKMMTAVICIVIAVAILAGVLIWRLGGNDPKPTDPSGSSQTTGQGSTGGEKPDPSTEETLESGLGESIFPEDTQIPTGTWPDDMSLPNNEPTQPSTEVTDPSTEPSGEPTEPSSNPTEPATQPTEPPAAEHTHDFVETVIEPNCVDNGYSRYECQCGAYYITDEIPAKGHTWSDWTVIKQPTTTESGSKTHTCTVCNTTETRPIPVHEHSYKTTWVDPTCEEPGYNYHICSCGRDYKSDAVDPIGHNWSEWKITVEPTTSSTGERTRSCSNCKKVVTETVPALDPDTGVAYERYIDPRITVKEYFNNTGYKYGDFSVTDFRTWGEPPSIWINEDGTWLVVYFNKDGTRVEVLLELPPADYIRSFRILDDGTYIVTLTGGYNK